jgi:hypothetical protein
MYDTVTHIHNIQDQKLILCFSAIAPKNRILFYVIFVTAIEAISFASTLQRRFFSVSWKVWSKKWCFLCFAKFRAYSMNFRLDVAKHRAFSFFLYFTLLRRSGRVEHLYLSALRTQLTTYYNWRIFPSHPLSRIFILNPLPDSTQHITRIIYDYDYELKYRRSQQPCKFLT